MKGSDQENHRIVFELKEGCTRNDTIIEIGQAKAFSLNARVKRLRRTGQEIPDLIELCSFSRGELRHGLLK